MGRPVENPEHAPHGFHVLDNAHRTSYGKAHVGID
jgi:hypothetical protein